MLDAGVRHLQSLPFVRRDRVGAVGFCFGGGVTWRLATGAGPRGLVTAGRGGR